MTEPNRTRREHGEAGDSTRREPPAGGPAATRREPGEVSATTADPSPLAPGQLPVHLRHEAQDAIPWKTSGEAQLFLLPAADHADQQRVLKVYFPHITLDPAVSAHLPTLRSKHVVEVVETGTLADDRAFELMQHLPAGTLRDNGAGSQVFDAAKITEFVRQLTTGLRTLHQHGIIHRDLKPENVLVRNSGEDLELVLSDFGLSRKLTGTAHFTTVGQTPTYAAPESWAGHVSSALDWWALGMMALELATGHQPFAGLDVLMVQKAVTTKPVPVDAIADARLRQLCAGLLVSDETLRWTEVQVLDWLAGGSPDVPDRRMAIEASEFEFANRRFRDIASLTEAMSRDWRLAARRFGMAHGPSWRAFTTWLDQFNHPNENERGVVEHRLELLDRLERSKDKPDAKLLRLLAGLNPKLPPIYRQTHVDQAKLRELARTAQGDEQSPETRQAREVIGDLHDGKLLAVLAEFAGAADLGQVARDWRARLAELNAAARTLRQYDQLAAVFTDRNRQTARAAMLELAAGGRCAEDWLRQFHDQAGTLAEPVAWFDDVRRCVGDDHVRAYAGLHAVGIAVAQAAAAVRARKAAEQAKLAREQAWANSERRRLAGRPTAVGWAIAGTSAPVVMWLLAAAIGQQGAALVFVFLAVLTHVTAELVLAGVLAADYQPRYSLWHAMLLSAGWLGRQMRAEPRGWTIGIVVAALLLIAVLGWLKPLAAVAAGTAHVWWGVRRYRRWSTAHAQLRQQAMWQ